MLTRINAFYLQVRFALATVMAGGALPEGVEVTEDDFQYGSSVKKLEAALVEKEKVFRMS